MLGKLKDKKEVASSTLKVVFETSEPFTFRPGQYCFITLKNPPYPDERSNKRHFSIVNSPNQNGIITFTTRLRPTGFKKSLQVFPIGTEVELGPIAGVFTLPEDTTTPLVFIAGGIGITPFMSMLQYEKEENLDHQITLVYSNRDQSSSVFLKELQELANSLPNFKLILTMTEDNNWSGEKRMVNADFIKDYFPNVNSQKYMVVGPPPMVEAVEKSLHEAGVTPENIKIENFTGY
ncbi:FAD-dependent oxidoreductase [Candidatus Daviesbacteria bacterium]|nr:FAD-dependent oxidoreductase [Candidatus Daviesbacteria bacterium]